RWWRRIRWTSTLKLKLDTANQTGRQVVDQRPNAAEEETKNGVEDRERNHNHNSNNHRADAASRLSFMPHRQCRNRSAKYHEDEPIDDSNYKTNHQHHK